MLMNDIHLPDGVLWHLPEDFLGCFISKNDANVDYLLASHDEDKTVYDEESDTVYIYHQYQIAVISSETANPCRGEK